MASVPGFTRPTLTEIQRSILDDINTRLPGAESRLRRATLNVMAAVLSGAAHLLYGFISFIAKNIMIDTAETAWLERHSSIWGVTRKAATFATGTATITGVNGFVLPLGHQVQRADGVLFVTETDGEITDGEAEVVVSALNAGVEGNTEPGTKMALVSPYFNIDSEMTVVTLSGGVGVESDDDLRARLLLRIQETPHGGIKTDYEQWALEVGGVTRAWAYPNELGAGTTTVRFVMDEKAGTIIPDAGEVATVQIYLDAKRPVTAAVIAAAPALVPMDFTINISPDSASIRNAVQAQLTDMLYRDGAPGNTIFLSRIQEAISVASGESYHTLTSPSANVTHTPGQMPSMGVITWV